MSTISRMSLQGEAPAMSSEIVDLVSDDDSDDNEQSRSFYKLAALRSLIPPKFFLCSSENDFDFFSEELAVSLLNASWKSFIDSKRSLQSSETTTENCQAVTTSAVGSTNLKLQVAKESSVFGSEPPVEPAGSNRSRIESVASNKSITLPSLSASVSNSEGNQVSADSPKSCSTRLKSRVSTKSDTTATASCSASTKRPESLPKLPRRTYDCFKCNQKFNYNVALLDHLANVHKLCEESVNSMSQHPRLFQPTGKKKKKSSSLKVSQNQNSETRKKRKLQKDERLVPLTKAKIAPRKPSSENCLNLEPDVISDVRTSSLVMPSIPILPNIKMSSSPPPDPLVSSEDTHCSENLVIDESVANDSDAANDNAVDNPNSDASDSGISDVDEYMKSFTFLTFAEVETSSGIKYRCSVCDKYFSQMELVLDHYDKCAVRKCIPCSFPSCSKLDFTPSQYKTHLKVKHNILTYSCKVCKSYFAETQKLKTHRLYCVNKEHTQYHCPTEGCHMNYFYELHFRKHLAQRHNIRECILCKVCKLFFTEEADLKEHVETDVHKAADKERQHRLAMAEEQKKAEKLLAEKKKSLSA